MVDFALLPPAVAAATDLIFRLRMSAIQLVVEICIWRASEAYSGPLDAEDPASHGELLHAAIQSAMDLKFDRMSGPDQKTVFRQGEKFKWSSTKERRRNEQLAPFRMDRGDAVVADGIVPGERSRSGQVEASRRQGFLVSPSALSSEAPKDFGDEQNSTHGIGHDDNPVAAFARHLIGALKASLEPVCRKRAGCPAGESPKPTPQLPICRVSASCISDLGIRSDRSPR